MNIRSISTLVVLALASLFSVAGLAAGFNCATATGQVEKAICASAPISRLDEEMTDILANAIKLNREKQAVLEAGQRAWIRQRDSQCINGQVNRCLVESYGQHMAWIYLTSETDNLRRVKDICSKAPSFSDAIMSGSQPDHRLDSYMQARCTLGVVKAIGSERLNDADWESRIETLSGLIGEMAYALETKRKDCDAACVARHPLDVGQAMTSYLNRIIDQYYAFRNAP
ncbi:lysozyme inhibitor LprI family protein [Pokkaliibacter sp. CJK22405]|uniref:lysozyme inhibitor LprI family protein n=1 Tax=Pokkaliibacter sp. CJK22405 TaxID=3384615 RepID=UPI003984A311